MAAKKPGCNGRKIKKASRIGLPFRMVTFWEVAPASAARATRIQELGPTQYRGDVDVAPLRKVGRKVRRTINQERRCGQDARTEEMQAGDLFVAPLQSTKPSSIELGFV